MGLRQGVGLSSPVWHIRFGRLKPNLRQAVYGFANDGGAEWTRTGRSIASSVKCFKKMRCDSRSRLPIISLQKYVGNSMQTKLHSVMPTQKHTAVLRQRSGSKENCHR